MIRSLPCLILLAPLLAAAPKDDDWAVRGAPYRVEIRAGTPPTRPEAGWEIQLPDFGSGRADLRDVVLLGPDRKEIALDGIWRGPGRTMLLLAEAMPAAGASAMLYFGGGSSRQMRSWHARRSLLLETRRMPAGADIATYGGWQKAWQRAKEVDGMGFVPLVFHGENPFGESSRMLSRYTGWINTGDSDGPGFYTLSNDSSYVMIDGRPALSWQGNEPPPLQPDKVKVVNVRVPRDCVAVEYCHGAVDAPAAMVLGWNRDGKLGNVPPDAWVHPGQTTAGSITAADNGPVPLANVTAERYLGIGGEWYFIIRASLPDPGAAWQVEWIWPDGRVTRGNETRRLWMNQGPLRLGLRLRHEARTCDGYRILMMPRDLPGTNPNDKRAMSEWLELLENESPESLPEPDRRAGFLLARTFLPPASAARWAEAWLAVATPAGGPWTVAMAAAMRESIKRDPRAALERLTHLPQPARAALGGTADLLELELRVFSLNDPAAVALATRLRQCGDKFLAKMALIRLGDYHLLNDRQAEAARCYAEAAPDRVTNDSKGPVIDRAHSLAIEDLLKAQDLDAAQAKLREWELQRPAARLEGDQLLWRARVMFLAGDHARALQDLETSLKVRAGAPEDIDVRFWQGRALFELGRKDEARKIWQHLMKEYPKHERAEEAKPWAAKP